MPCDVSSRPRVFISYSREDRHHATAIAAHLDDLEFDPMWDDNFVGGQGFPEQIQLFIAHSHLFLPLITENSITRGWVHQEIGYATALQIPVIPVGIGQDPQGIIRDLHSVRLDETLTTLSKKLTKDLVNSSIEAARTDKFPLFECARTNSERARMFVNYTKGVRALNRRGCVRQRGALTSFNIPDKRSGHRDWLLRYGGKRRDPDYCRSLREERVALEEHAKNAGCKLIVDPSLTYEGWGPSALPSRIRCLAAFLNKLDDAKVQIAIDARHGTQESVTIVGDWFSAKSVSASLGSGYRHTIFTRHAPTIEREIADFDEYIDELFEDMKCTPEESRSIVLRKLMDLYATTKHKELLPDDEQS